MAGSPRYIHLLAETGQVAQTHLQLWESDVDDIWDAIDAQWESIEQGDYDDPGALLTLSALAMAQLHLLTGISIEELVDKGVELHIGKNRGYAGAENPDPWANFRMASVFGSTPFAGSMIRCGDKYMRLVNLRKDPDNDQVDEPIAETLRDFVAYPLISRCLLEEEEGIAA